MVRIMNDDWSIRLGENRRDQTSQTFGSHAFIRICSHEVVIKEHSQTVYIYSMFLPI